MQHDHSEQLLGELRWLRGLAVALAQGDAQLAEDLVQDGAVALLEPRGPVRSIRAWLATVVRRRATVLRAKKAQPLDSEPASDDEGLEIAARLEAQQRLNATVLALADPYRAVIVGHHLDGVSLADLARQRGASAATVRQQHKRGLDMLRQRLDQDDAGSGWRLAIAPLLAAPSGLKTGFVAAGAAVATTGGILMLKKLLAAAAVIVCAWWAWQLANPKLAAPSTKAAGSPPIAAAAGELPAAGTGRGAADPQRESAGPAPATDLAEELLLEVRGSTGAALAGAVVHCGPNGQTSRFGMTDANGRLRMKGWQQAGEAWVWARDRAPFRQSLPELFGQHRVALPDSPVVEGLVTVDGKPPGEPIVLCVHWRDEAPRPELPSGWSGRGERTPLLEDSVAHGSPWGGWLHPDFDWRATVVVEPSGRFTLRGAQREQLGRIGVGGSGWAGLGPYRLMGPSGEPVTATYVVPDVSQPIHIKLLRSPSLCATFVFPDGEPVAAGRLQVSTIFSDGQTRNHEGGLTDAQGRVHRALVPSETGGPSKWWRQGGESLAAHALKVRLSHPDAAPMPLLWNRTVLANSTRGRLIDLGKVVVSRINRLVVQVLDPDEQPVAGIQALLHSDLSQPTESDGRVTIEVAERGLSSLWVAGPGWGAQEAKNIGGVGTDDDPLRLRIKHRANRLIVTIPEGFAGKEAEQRGLRFGLESSKPIFPATRRPNGQRAWGPSDLHEAAGGTGLRSWSSGSADTPARVSHEVSEGREIVLVGITPGQRVTAWLEDGARQRILERSATAPPWGQEARVELQGEPSQSIHQVRVQFAGLTANNDADEPVVYCHIPNQRDVRVDLDDAGKGKLQLHASSKAAELVVAAKGAVMQRLPIQLTPGEHTMHVKLQPAQSLTVALTDRDGAPVAGILYLDSGLTTPWGIRELLGTEKPATRHVLTNAPPGATPVVVHLGGHSFRRTVQRPQDGSDAQLVVQRPVSLALQLPRGTVGQEIELRWRPEAGVVGETNTHAFTFGQNGWRPSTIPLLPGRYHYTLHRRWRDEVTAQGVVTVQQHSEHLRLDVAIPTSDR